MTDSKSSDSASSSASAVVIRTTEMHTAGEPVRIVIAGYPEIKGSTILDKRRYAKEHLDHLRKLLMFEPRGHDGMYGVLQVKPDAKDADLAVLFMHNEGYSTMCGHATIALGRWAVDTKQVKVTEPETVLRLQVPCGVVETRVKVKDGKASSAKFRSVPAFALAVDVKVDVPGFGTITVDIGFGGAFYALVPAAAVKLDVSKSSVRDLTDAGDRISKAVREKFTITHPTEADLSFLYGTILTDGKDDFSSEPTANICIFADREVDRSPCGSGVTARMACQYAKKQVTKNQLRSFMSPTKGVFTGEVVDTCKLGGHDAVVVEVGGQGYYSGSCEFTVEPDDPLRGGFLLT